MDVRDLTISVNNPNHLTRLYCQMISIVRTKDRRTQWPTRRAARGGFVIYDLRFANFDLKEKQIGLASYTEAIQTLFDGRKLS